MQALPEPAESFRELDHEDPDCVTLRNLVLKADLLPDIYIGTLRHRPTLKEITAFGTIGPVLSCSASGLLPMALGELSHLSQGKVPLTKINITLQMGSARSRRYLFANYPVNSPTGIEGYFKTFGCTEDSVRSLLRIVVSKQPCLCSDGPRGLSNNLRNMFSRSTHFSRGVKNTKFGNLETLKNAVVSEKIEVKEKCIDFPKFTQKL